MLCALSLMLVAFAHKPLVSSAAASAYAEVNIAEFILPDGTLPELCLDGEADAHHSAASSCEACRIVSSVDLPAPMDGFITNRRLASVELVLPSEPADTRPALRPGASPRGPPAFTA